MKYFLITGIDRRKIEIPGKIKKRETVTINSNVTKYET
jgi:hypothetical protein